MCGGQALDIIRNKFGTKQPILSSGGATSMSGMSVAKAMSGGGGGRKRAAKLPQAPALGSTTDQPTG
jgi:hypothetical protein